MTPRTSAAAAAAAPIATIAAVPELGEDGMMPPAAEWVHPGELVPWARNPRRNDGEPVAKVAASIAEFGFAAPIVARRATREIIAGHTRWKAAQQLGLERVPVRFVDLTEERAHLLALADNRLGELAEWDTAELAALLADYEAPDIEIAGWSAAELAKLEEAAESEGEEGAELGGSAEGASFRVYSIEAIADALVPALLGRTMADFAPPLPDVMAAINRCAAHASGGPLSRLTDRWFPQRYDVLAGKSPETPNQALQSEATIRGVATKLTMGSMGSWGEVRVALSHFGIYNGRQCARQFPIARARDIFLELSRPDARVLDPCAGWGGRLIGWMCALQGGSYRGIDASAEGCRGFARMIGELRVENAAVEHAAFEDVELEAEAYDFAFTSPPYFTLERYGTDPEQAEVRYPTYEAWRAGFLAVLIRNTLRALRPGAAFALVVSRAGDYDIPKDALECARAEGASVDSRSINIGGASTHKLQGRGDSEYEDLLVLRKPGTAAAKRGAA
jgi:hypothetical protein